MNYTITIIHCATLTLVLVVCVYLFVSVKRELHASEARWLRRGEGLRTELREVAEELETLRKELETMEQKSDPIASVARALGSGTRIQALRMIKHGEGPEHISAALGLPRNEIELLIKVQRLMSEQPASATS